MRDCVLANKSIITDGNDPWFHISHPVEGSTVWITTNWKILKAMGMPVNLTYLLRNLYACQETMCRTGHRKTEWFKTGKGVKQGCMLSP